MPSSMLPEDPSMPTKRRFLPRLGSPGYHIMLTAVAIFILGPLGGISAAFMNFSIGFFVGGQVLAGILGSTVTLPYGPEGKHGANYLQTMASSVAGMCGMAVLVQAMSWLGIPQPPMWQLVLYFLCIGMFGVGVGMLYTPIVVDRMQLAYPSGFAVANILRALTDKDLLKRSVIKLGGGLAAGFLGGLASLNVAWCGAIGLSTSTFGAGMIVGARLALSGLVLGLVGAACKPMLVHVGWLGPDDPFRKIGFIIALGMILGAALLDVSLLLVQAARRLRDTKPAEGNGAEDWKNVNQFRLILWIVFWATALVVVGHVALGQPLPYLLVAVALSFVFVLINGIAAGISDSNPISSAFVLTVFILAGMGLRDPKVGLMCAAILLIACSEGGDMQQDRSTGWRLGTNRIVQFRYQVIGITMGAFLSVLLAKVFMSAYPVLKIDQFSHHVEGAKDWQSAMTYKFVGALRGITQPGGGHIMTALVIGVSIGLVTEILRKRLSKSVGYQKFIKSGKRGWVVDFLVDAVFLPSPYASSFGGFVELNTLYWWAGGGVISSLYDGWMARRKAKRTATTDAELPSDMSAMSLIGGGLIAGDSLAALAVGIAGLITTVFH